MLKNIILYLLPTVFMMMSCGGQSNRAGVSDMSAADSASIEGQWLLEQVVVNDTLYVRPAEIDPAWKLYARFYNDSTFGFQTGCNAIGGKYIQTGETISMSDMMWTEMACENMRVEELLKDVLPQVKSVDWSNDSTVRLNTSSSAYIVLKKCDTKGYDSRKNR